MSKIKTSELNITKVNDLLEIILDKNKFYSEDIGTFLYQLAKSKDYIYDGIDNKILGALTMPYPTDMLKVDDLPHTQQHTNFTDNTSPHSSLLDDIMDSDGIPKNLTGFSVNWNALPKLFFIQAKQFIMEIHAIAIQTLDIRQYYLKSMNFEKAIFASLRSNITIDIPLGQFIETTPKQFRFLMMKYIEDHPDECKEIRRTVLKQLGKEE